MIVLSEGHRCKKLPKIGLFQLDRKLTQQNSISKQNETQTLAYYPIIETSLQKTQNLLPYLRQSKLWFQNSNVPEKASSETGTTWTSMTSASPDTGSTTRTVSAEKSASGDLKKLGFFLLQGLKWNFTIRLKVYAINVVHSRIYIQWGIETYN